MSLPEIAAVWETSLASPITSASTSLTLTANAVRGGGALSGLVCITVDEGSAQAEIVCGTVDGTEMTSLIRGVSYADGKTSVNANKFSHRRGANIKITDAPIIQLLKGMINGDDALPNSLRYATEPTLSNREELATKGYVDDSGSAGAISYAKVIATGNAGETFTIGRVLYFNTTDQEWYRADADTAYGDDTQFGIAQGAGTDGVAITGGVLVRGTDTNQSGMTPGASQYISTTVGDITQTAPTNDIFVGVAKSATELFVNFENRITDFVSTNEITQSAVLQTQLVSTNTIAVGEADATTKNNDLAQRFVATKTKMRGASLFKKADTGTFTGTVTVSLQADAGAGIAPTGTNLATVTLTNAKWLGLSAAEFEAIFTTEYGALVIGAFYWIVVTTSTADNSNHPNLGADTSGGDGTVYYRNATNGWVQLASSFLYYKTLEGNVNQVVKTGATGKIDEDLIPASTAIPFFQQDLALNQVESLVSSTELLLGSSTDGSQLFVHIQNSGLIYRYQRDAKSGQYKLTHNANPTITPSNGDGGGFVVIGIHLYIFFSNGANIACSRFLAADLTGETTMTVPTVACFSSLGVWSNGVDVYLVSQSSETTSRRWSVSGTVFTAVSTATVVASRFATNENCYFYDGTFAYLSRTISGNLDLYRLDNIDGSTTTLISSNKQGLYSNGTQVGAPAVNINADLCYQGVIYNTYTTTVQNSTRISLRPISK